MPHSAFSKSSNISIISISSKVNSPTLSQVLHTVSPGVASVLRTPSSSTRGFNKVESTDQNGRKYISRERGMMVITGDNHRVDPSPASSCISSDDEDNQLKHTNRSPKIGKPLVLVGCQRCLMYMMLSPDESKCPKCAGSVLLEFSSHGGVTLTKKR